MRAFVIEHEGKIQGYTTTFAAAIGTIRNTWSAFPRMKIDNDLTSIVVSRPGFDDLRYLVLPIEIWETAQHL